MNCAHLIAMVTGHYGVCQHKVFGPSRHRSIVRPRMVAAYVCHKASGKPLKVIGRALGGRHHTTIMHSIRWVEQAMAGDAQLRGDVEAFLRGEGGVGLIEWGWA